MSRNFPQLSQSAKTAEMGVSLVSRIVSDVFGWIFKRNHQEHDFGIDGQVELVTTDGAVTGQMFAVQIKCGKSYLSERNEWGFTYRGERKHLNHLANYPVPVILCLCDPESGDCYWVRFSLEETEGTEAGWTILVPTENLLSQSKPHIEALLWPVHEATSELEEYWKLNKILEGIRYNWVCTWS